MATTVLGTITNDSLVQRHIEAITAVTKSAYKGISIAALIEECKVQMRQGTCHFVFLKKDGTTREAFGTLNHALLNKHLKGTGQSPENWGCCYYFDIEKGASRSFKWENLIAVLS